MIIPEPVRVLIARQVSTLETAACRGQGRMTPDVVLKRARLIMRELGIADGVCGIAPARTGGELLGIAKSTKRSSPRHVTPSPVTSSLVQSSQVKFSLTPRKEIQ